MTKDAVQLERRLQMQQMLVEENVTLRLLEYRGALAVWHPRNNVLKRASSLSERV
ncbi:MAG: hypothetical protein GTO41_21165 [Burkholderiales bacterium]|nr:hypothetical protein [Burkholderiales bacterium]